MTSFGGFTVLTVAAALLIATADHLWPSWLARLTGAGCTVLGMGATTAALLHQVDGCWTTLLGRLAVVVVVAVLVGALAASPLDGGIRYE